MQVALLVAYFLWASNDTKFMLAEAWGEFGLAGEVHLCVCFESHVHLLSVVSVNWWF